MFQRRNPTRYMASPPRYNMAACDREQGLSLLTFSQLEQRIWA
jgi:hypothetical protein